MDFSPTPPEAVRWIATRLENEGFETWVVGGAIRDLLLGYPAGDWDFATRATPTQIMAAFPRTVPVGVDHGTVGVLARDRSLYEVTTFRRDVENHGRRAVVEFAETIEEDLARRDFTINAIAWHPIRGELRDPMNGRDDLKSGVLRTVGVPAERFAEDYLRVLRALRLSGQFDFAIEEESWLALTEAVSRLGELSVERVQEELFKVLSRAEAPSVALRLYERSGALRKLYPEVVDAAEAADGPVLDRVFAACDCVPRTRPLVRLAVLLAPLAYGSDSVCVVRSRVENLLVRLRCSNADTRFVSRLVANRVMGVPDTQDVSIRRWLHATGHDLFPATARTWLAEARAGVSILPRPGGDEVSHGGVVKRIKYVRSVLQTRPPLSAADLVLNGGDLREMGFEPGPVFGEILEHLVDHVLEHPEANTRYGLKEAIAAGGFTSSPSVHPDQDKSGDE